MNEVPLKDKEMYEDQMFLPESAALFGSYGRTCLGMPPSSQVDSSSSGTSSSTSSTSSSSTTTICLCGLSLHIKHVYMYVCMYVCIYKSFKGSSFIAPLQ